MTSREAETGSGARPDELYRLISLNDAAGLLGVSRRTVVSLVSSGDLASIKIGGRTLIHPRDLDAFVEERRRRGK